MPGPIVMGNDSVESESKYRWATNDDYPSIGRLSTFMGNAGVLIRAWFYARVLGGSEGMQRVGGTRH